MLTVSRWSAAWSGRKNSFVKMTIGRASDGSNGRTMQRKDLPLSVKPVAEIPHLWVLK